MKLKGLMLLMGCSLMVATGCPAGDDDDDDNTTRDGGTTTTRDGGSTQPDGGFPDSGVVTGESIFLNFCINDAANKTYTQAAGLAWKGSFAYDADTNKIAFNAAWGGPFPALYDDGPISEGGHEPEGEEANDSIWCISAEFDVPTDADTDFEYGAIRGSVDGSDGDWIWTGASNGRFTIEAGQTTDEDVPGMTIAAFGTIDFRLTIDTSTLAPDFAAFDPADGITVKSSSWGWTEIETVDDGTAGDETAGDGIFTFRLSDHVGAGSELPFNGLLKAGDEAEFVFVLGGVEYKVAGVPPTNGITASVNPGTGWIDLPIENRNEGSNVNTYIAVPTELFAPPANHVAVSFTIDDSANQTYTDADGLAWKGSFSYDSTTRIATRDPAWGGPFALVYDDGPWNAGGHEPAGATAGDHIFGITMWIPVPTAEEAFEYGAIRGSVDGSDGQWIWQGSNGTFTVPANASDPIATTGLVIPAHGTTDFRLVIDTANLAPEFAAFDPANGITVKSSGWGWSEIMCVDDGTTGDVTASDGLFTFVLSNHVGTGTMLPHNGLLASGDEPEFVFVLGGVEYKVSGAASAAGVTASVMPAAGAWTDVTIETRPSPNGNTFISVP